MSGAMLVALISITASLFLAVRALRSHSLSLETRAGMAVAWLLIIGILAFILDRVGV